MTNKEKEIDEMVDIIVEELDKSYGCGLEIAGEKIYHIYRRKRKDACEKTAKKVRKETAKEILDLLIRYDDGDSNSEAIKLIIDHYGLKEYIEVDE